MDGSGAGAPPVTRLAGRDRELRELDRHLTAARAGEGRLLLLEGPAGIGKSALLAELRPLAAAAGVRWLSARGSELERDYPFGIVRQLLEPALVGEGDEVPEGAAALAGGAFGAPDAAGAVTEPGFAVLHGLFWLVVNLAERRPLVLCVDDVQWADAPSLRFLDHLALRLDGLPVLGALAARAGDAALTVGPIARLLAHADVHPMRVDPLTPEAVGRMVGALLEADVPADLVAACHEVTGGNAFLVREVAGELRRSGRGAAADPAVIRSLAPPAIVRSLRLRLEALPADAVALARAVAVLGDGCALRAAAQLAWLEADAARAGAETLAEADLLAPQRPLRFAHAVVAAAAREGMGAEVRGELHRRAARMAAAGRDGPPDLDAAAGHLLAVDPDGDPEAARVLRAAAAQASRRGAADTASTYLRRALAEPPAAAELPGVLVDLAGAAGFAGEGDALVFAERALEVAPSADVRLAAAREAAMVHVTAGRHEVAAATMAAVLDDPALDPVSRMAGEGLLLISAAIAADARRAHATRMAAARDLVARLGDAAPAALLVLAGFELVLVDGEVARGAELVTRALAGGRLLRESTADSPVPYIATNALIVAGRYELAEATVNEVLADAAARGSIRAYALGTAQRGLCRLRHGRIAAAEADARASLERHEGRSVVQRCVASATLAGALAEGGDLAGAEAALRGVPAEARRPETHLGPVAEDLRARLLAAQGRWEEALMATGACAAWERAFGVRHGGWTAWRAVAANAHAALGDSDRAVELADEGVALARAYGVARTLGLALRGAGLVHGDPARLQEAVAVLEAGGVRGEAARAAVHLGAVLEREGRAAGARAAYDDALARAEACGSRRSEQAARDGLVRLGARPRRREVSGVHALTAGERRVAELAAAGTPNRAIAEQLFLTRKTVENHLTATYRKLGIASRAQLADRLEPTRVQVP